MNKNTFVFECNECGKLAPIDTKKSNKNWAVYKTGKCVCGGNYRIQRLNDLSENEF